MKRIVYLLIFLFSTSAALAQDFETRFEKYFDEENVLKLSEVLTKWESEDPEDPQFYICYFQYSLFKAKQETHAFFDFIGKSPTDFGVYTIPPNPTTLKKGVDKLSAGLKLYPSRIDYRVGIIHGLAELGNWEGMTDELLKLLHYSVEIDYNWTSVHKIAEDERKEVLLDEIVLEYQSILFDSNDDDWPMHVRRISEEVLNYYPNHIQSFISLSMSYLPTKRYDKALEILFQAKKIDPNHPMVLLNIGDAYGLKGDQKTGIVYYHEVINYASKDNVALEIAKDRLRELNKLY